MKRTIDSGRHLAVTDASRDASRNEDENIIHMHPNLDCRWRTCHSTKHLQPLKFQQNVEKSAHTGPFGASLCSRCKVANALPAMSAGLPGFLRLCHIWHDRPDRRLLHRLLSGHAAIPICLSLWSAALFTPGDQERFKIFSKDLRHCPLDNSVIRRGYGKLFNAGDNTHDRLWRRVQGQCEQYLGAESRVVWLGLSKLGEHGCFLTAWRLRLMIFLSRVIGLSFLRRIILMGKLQEKSTLCHGVLTLF